MRMTILFLFIIPLSVSAAQEKVSVKGKAITVKEAIKLIEKNSAYSFFWNVVTYGDGREKTETVSFYKIFGTVITKVALNQVFISITVWDTSCNSLFSFR